MKELRRAANERTRRVIYNNDGDEPFQIANPTVEDLLNLRTSALPGTHVDSIFFCAHTSFGTFKRFTKVGQMFTLQEGHYAANKLPELIRRNIDPLRVMLEFAQKYRIEFFASFRMNDTHDGSTAAYGPVRFRFNRLKNEHPEYLLASKDSPLKYGSWAGVNYARREIRDLALSYFEEVCREYDVDGLELDFFRHPVFFKSTGRGEKATVEELGQMTDLVRRLRHMADDYGRRRGRPILIAMKLPDSVEYCRAIGLDLGQWLQEDLLDILIPSGYFQLNDWDYSVALARRHGIKVYPSLDEARTRDEIANELRMTVPSYRARATRVWHAGADGVYLFNAFVYFGPQSPLWRELGDPEVLRRLDRDYFASVRGTGSSPSVNFPLTGYQTIETLSPRAPAAVLPGRTTSIRIDMADAFRVGDSASVLLRIRLTEPDNEKSLRVAFNEQEPRFLAASPVWTDYVVSPALLRPGMNLVAMTLSPTATKSSTVQDIMVQIRMPKP